jgi:hypothetical protein
MKHIPTIIEELFHNELSRHNWTKYSTKMIKEIITTKYHMRNTISETGPPPSDLELHIILKKLKDTLPIEEALIILTDEMLGRLID